jgi:Porin subfamily
VFSGTNGLTNGTSIAKSNAWGFRGAYTHNWDAYWNTSLFGSYSALRWGSTGGAIICNGTLFHALAALSPTFVCNPDFNIAQIGAVTRWTPVKNLTFSAEAMYTYLDQKNSGTINAILGTPGSNNLIGAPKPNSASYDMKSQGTLTVGVRAQRVF